MFKRLYMERARSRAVARLVPVAASAEPGYDRLLENATSAFSAPIALLTVLRGRQINIIAAHGIEFGCVARRDSFCTHAIDRPSPTEICDASIEAAVRDLPSVRGAPHIRYYIGAPLRLADGPSIGMLCILDTVARPAASSDQRAYLTSLARQATELLERNVRFKGAIAA